MDHLGCLIENGRRNLRPRASAVFRLMTRSKRWSRSLRRSPGFAPCKILSTYDAEWRATHHRHPHVEKACCVARPFYCFVRSLYWLTVKNLHASYCRWINSHDSLWSITSKISGIESKDMRHMMDKHGGSKACIIHLNTRHAILHNKPSPFRVDCR